MIGTKEKLCLCLYMSGKVNGQIDEQMEGWVMDELIVREKNEWKDEGIWMDE